MSFIYRCLAVEKPNRPLATRCKKAPDSKNGLLCKECLGKARRGPINILMHHEVSKTFGIPFHNQVCVTVNLSKGAKNQKPQSQNAVEEKIRHTKNHLREEMSDIDLKDLKVFHDKLGLDVWGMQKQKNEYAFRYLVIKNIIDKMLERSSVKK